MAFQNSGNQARIIFFKKNACLFDFSTLVGMLTRQRWSVSKYG
jgi:hypothetical protein